MNHKKKSLNPLNRFYKIFILKTDMNIHNSYLNAIGFNVVDRHATRSCPTAFIFGDIDKDIAWHNI